MRKILNIAFFILIMLFILRRQFLGKNYQYDFYIYLAFILLAVPYIMYESVQKAKDNNSKSQIFNPWVLVGAAFSLILITMFIVFELIYPLPTE